MISVIIPVYNVEEYLHDCLISVLNQSFQDFEIICVEDCSTDNSLEILENFAEIDNRITIIKNEKNSSLGFSRNVGLKYAKGEYILFLDSDDWLDFKTLEILYKTAKTNELDVLMFKAINFDDEKKVFYRDKYYSMEFMEKYLDKVFNYKNLTSEEIVKIVVSAWNKLYLKSFLIENNLKFPSGLIHEDNPFFYEMLYKAKKISLIDNYFYNRRRRMGSITTRKGKELLDVIEIIKRSIIIALDNIDVYEPHKTAILNRMFNSLKFKYKQIDEEYKEEYYNNARQLIQTFCLKYPFLWVDLNKCLDKENLDFLIFLNLSKWLTLKKTNY